VRAQLLAAIAGFASSTARADPRLEASGFVGVDWFGKHSELGNAWAAEQVPGTSPLLGARVTWIALPDLARGLELAVEGELGLAPAFTGDSTSAGRMSYFAPVIEWHAHALLRLDRWPGIAPHLVLGGGGETVASSSPFMAKETDPIAYWGLGATLPALASWHVRLDARHGLMPARGGGVTSTFEVSFGIGTTFGLPVTAAKRTAPRVAEPAVEPAVDDTDTDGDGIPDRLDRCPTERETVNGVADDDGCPEVDPDSDGILGDADKCPDQAEDFDGFEDSDGCPDPDNDGDGIDDTRDTCPSEPETVNGFEDDDGCPDELPAEITAALATMVKFEPGRARVTDTAGAALGRLLALLQARPALRIAIVGHPERPDAAGDDLARRRAEAVKWYLVDQGIAGDRIATRVAPAKPPAVTFELAAAPKPAR
jgi:OOP family OmpA-OmpF porin